MKMKWILAALGILMLIGAASAISVTVTKSSGGGAPPVVLSITNNLVIPAVAAKKPVITLAPGETMFLSSNKWYLHVPFLTYSWVTPAMISVNNGLIYLTVKKPTGPLFYPSTMFYHPGW
jgi:hypothetical protein